MKRLTTKHAYCQYAPGQIHYLMSHVNYCFIHPANNEVILACGTSLPDTYA
ncbi:hypothetical protein [Spirosoma linguale]|uniref:hypothetical protein n=1 Tax=Spirosoma linguale TaxID=108 RepID=UPI0026D1DA02